MFCEKLTVLFIVVLTCFTVLHGCPATCICEDELQQLQWTCTSLSSADILSFNQTKINNSESEEAPEIIEDKQTNLLVEVLRFKNVNTPVAEDLLAFFPNLKKVEFIDSAINCTTQSIWLLKWSTIMVNPDDVLCTYPPTLNEVPIIKALTLIKDLNNQCPSQCMCELLHVPNLKPHVTIDINCTNLGLEEIPKHLPANANGIYLDLSKNQIKSLDDLVSNPAYGNVTHLYLNDNQIKSISPLLNTYWHFSMLSLQGNLLEEIPTQALTKSFRQAFGEHTDINGIGLYLGNNPLRCDCLTITNFMAFIAQHKEIIKDVSKVRCGLDEGVNAGKKIVNVDLSSVCVNPDQNIIFMMDLLNVFLGLLIVLLIGKLIYDYYAYSKTGQLPWLASKLP